MGGLARAGPLAVLILAIWVTPAQASSWSAYENESTGQISAQNGRVKVVWGTRANPRECYNRSGGSIYGLWDRNRDPGCERNLVQTILSGTGDSTPSTAGIGGFGATKVYRSGPHAISEVGSHSALLAKQLWTDAAGVLHVTLTFRVYAGSSPQYDIEKQWRVEASGLIRLRATWTWLANAWINDPCYNFAVSRNRGWQRVSWLSHDWQHCSGLGTDGWTNPANHWVYDPALASEADCDYAALHVQKFTFDKSAVVRPLTLAIETGHGGYENSGLFAFAVSIWSQVPGVEPLEQIAGEFSNYRTAGFGHEVRWGAWYSDDGGRLTLPGAPSRIRFVPAGTTWSDRFVIKLGY